LKTKIDLFEVLENVDNFNLEYIDGLSEDIQKQVSNYMLLKWMACSNDADKIHRLASAPNKSLFELGKHPSLVMHLLASCGLGKKDFYKWKKKQARKSNKPLTVELLKQYYNTSKDDAVKDSRLMDFQSMEEIAEDLGRYEDIPKLRKEFNA
jgi:hypothetical protein